MVIYGEPSIGLLITIVIVVLIFIGVGIKNWLEDCKDKIKIELANACVETEELLDKQIEATYKVFNELKEEKEKLIKAKGIIKKFLNAKSIEDTCVAESEAEKFIKEVK